MAKGKMSKCKGCPHWKWVRKDTLYDTRGYHYCEKNELTTCMKRNMSSIDSLPDNDSRDESKIASKDIEEEIDRMWLNWCEDVDYLSYLSIARHFAEWEAKSQEKKIADAYERGKQEGVRIVHSWESSPGQCGY